MREVASLLLTTGSTRAVRTGVWKYMRPVYVERQAPCTAACPLSNAIPRAMQAAVEGDADSALAIFLETNPIPGVTGRVCYRPCEDLCNRGKFDDPLSIRAVERWAADLGRADPPSPAPATGRRVAVVGSGPAGLGATYRLLLLGHRVSLFEKEPSPGGLLRFGIPPYRLPREVLDRELERILVLGPELFTSVEVGKDIPLQDLVREFDAVVLAPGLGRARRLGLPGEEHPSVRHGLPFLREAARGEGRAPGREVVVVGGGNVALDCARAALRLGAEGVRVVSLEGPDEMPAHPEELEEAAREGVRFLHRRGPVRFVVEEGELVGVEVLRCARVFDPEGRFAPELVPGTEELLAADGVVVAIGQEGAAGTLLEELHLSPVGEIPADNHGLTPVRGVFACGDAARSGGTVTAALAAGARTALAVHSYLTGEPLKEPAREKVGFSNIRLHRFSHAARLPQPHLAREDALEGFAEVNLGLPPALLKEEASRCFSCGLCSRCDICLLSCPEVAISRKGGGYEIDQDHCKGCGICVEECPRWAMAMVPVA